MQFCVILSMNLVFKTTLDICVSKLFIIYFKFNKSRPDLGVPLNITGGNILGNNLSLAKNKQTINKE